MMRIAPKWEGGKNRRFTARIILAKLKRRSEQYTPVAGWYPSTKATKIRRRQAVGTDSRGGNMTAAG